MSITLDVPEQLVELLQSLAQERGVPVEKLGTQALMLGLNSLAAGVVPETIEITPRAVKSDGFDILMRSPIISSAPVQARKITFEPKPSQDAD